MDPTLSDITNPEPSLEFLGYTDRWRALFAPYAEEGLTPARVIRADRGSVLAATGDGVIRAEPARRLEKEALSAEELPAAGDWIAVRTDTDLELPQIEAVLPRVSAFTRADPGRDAVTQVLAANIDTVFIIHPIAEEPNVRRLERELALAWDSGAVPVVVLAKADLSGDVEGAREAVEAIALGVDIHMTSAFTGEGVDALLAYADGHRTVALIGPSGAGKSTLINRRWVPTCRPLGRFASRMAEVDTPRSRGSSCRCPTAACSSTLPVCERSL